MTSPRTTAPARATVEIHGVTRQTFVLRAALAAGVAYGALATGPLLARAFAQSAGDVELLNYLLTLEYLERDFYAQAAKRVRGLSAFEKALTRELRDNESAHVDALTETIKLLEGKPVTGPTVAFGGAFASRKAYLALAATLEDTGVGAYNGAIGMIENPGARTTTCGIVHVEGRHAALIRLARGRAPAPRAFDAASERGEVLATVKPLIPSAGGFPPADSRSARPCDSGSAG